MKYIKYTLGILVLLTIGFFLLGIIKPKLSYDCEIMVNKSIAESWAVVLDERKMKEWLPGFQKIERISGTPETVGAVYNVHFDHEGQQMIIKETITEIIPNESISMNFKDDFMNMDYKMSMTSVDGKTKISSNTITEGNGIFSKSMMVLIGNSIKEQEEKNLTALKKAIEQNTKDYSDTLFISK